VLKIVIAEDDLMIADMAEEFLSQAGYDVCGIARTVSEAISLAHSCDPDLALIDLRLADGGMGTEIIAKLVPHVGLGILYASGNTSELVLTTTDGHACLTKPYRSTDLLRALDLVKSLVTTGAAIPPYPRGFRILPSPVNPMSHLAL
jgi:DNA-binding response OmpR family regulator